MTAPPPAVEFLGISKMFGDCVSAEDLHFQILRGDIHAIVGENGAGKSTAMKILFGLYKPDSGQLKINGQFVNFKSPSDAMRFGVGMVHQHFMLAEPLTALENILLFQKSTSAFQGLNRREHRARLQQLAEQYQFQIDWDLPVHKLSVGTQQRIEILKILSQDSNIIILDEPTAVLTPQETEDLFINIRKLKSEGRTVIIITHKLKEVMAVADSVTVLRHCRVVAQKRIADVTVESLAEDMVGRKLKNLNLRERREVTADAGTVLNISDLQVLEKYGSLDNIQLRVHRGEIVGVAGVEGNGQDSLIQALLNPRALKLRGKIEIKTRSTVGLSPERIRFLGVAAFPEDRLRFGMLADRPAYENFILGFQHATEYSSWGFLKFAQIFAKTKAAMDKFDVRPRDIFKALGKMSGGNQQKLVVARELQNNPDFILAAKPTRGVDIGAIEFIHEQLLESRERGAGVLLVSSELEELMILSDRIVVLFKGNIVAEYHRAQGFNEIALGAAMGGQG
jgi:ABC-type uncharacterized transport system ATPase subunit